MRQFSMILVILPLAVMAAQAGSSFSSVTDLQGQAGGLGAKGLQAELTDFMHSFQKGPGASIFLAHSGADWPPADVKKPESGTGKDLDLRYVDWDSVKAGATRQDKDLKKGDSEEESDSVDKEDEDDDEEKDDKDEKDEGCGWDRLWDAPKLG